MDVEGPWHLLEYYYFFSHLFFDSISDLESSRPTTKPLAHVFKAKAQSLRDSKINSRDSLKEAMKLKKTLKQQTDGDKDRNEEDEDYDDDDYYYEDWDYGSVTDNLLWEYVYWMWKSDMARIFFDGFKCLSPAINANDWTVMLAWGTTYKSQLGTIDYTTIQFDPAEDMYEVVELGLHSVASIIMVVGVLFGEWTLNDVSAYFASGLMAFYRAFVAVYLA